MANSMRTPPTPVSNEQAALEQLEERFEVDDEPLTHDMAVDHLLTAGFERGAAVDLIEYLRMKAICTRATTAFGSPTPSNYSTGRTTDRRLTKM
jgi:hypothetical protein